MPRPLQHLRRFFQRELLVRLLFRCEVGYLPACELGDAGEHVAQILMQSDASSSATFYDCVYHGVRRQKLAILDRHERLGVERKRQRTIYFRGCIEAKDRIADSEF